MRYLGRYHVAPGTSYISTSTDITLTAALGTCVGVAVYDRDTGIGGLLHLLLDEPPNPGNVREPEKYASTGVPLFLKKLKAAGASQQLTVWLAGGAIVGPVLQGDVIFDIGGKTVDCVKKSLLGEGVELIESETEGFFTCILALDLGSGECTIEPVGFEKTAESQPILVPSKNEIYNSIDHLKPIPQTALKILRLTSDEEVPFCKIAQELKKDQVLAARTLHICNSAQFTKLNKIVSLDHALSYLGQNNLIKFVVAAALELFFSQVVMGYSLCKGGLYYHAVGTAIIAEKIATKTNLVEPQAAYVAGLLHDIGKIVLDQHIQAVKPLFYRELHESGKSDFMVEQDLLGVDHSQAGQLLAIRWSLPETLVEVIRYHHYPSQASVSPEMVGVTFLADLLKSGFHPELEVQRSCVDELGAVLRTLGLSYSDIPHLIDDIPLISLTIPDQVGEQ